jgi:hypothetical protein
MAPRFTTVAAVARGGRTAFLIAEQQGEGFLARQRLRRGAAAVLIHALESLPS